MDGELREHVHLQEVSYIIVIDFKCLQRVQRLVDNAALAQTVLNTTENFLILVCFSPFHFYLSFIRYLPHQVAMERSNS